MPSQYPDMRGRGPDPEKLTEGRPWWKVCCGGCCIGVLVLFVVIPLFLQFVFRSAPKRVESLPESYPSQLVLFRPEDAVEILYYPAESKSQVTRVLSAPLALMRHVPVPDSVSSSTSAEQVGEAIQTELRRVEGRDTVAVRWANLDATRNDVLRFYAGALRQAGMPQAQVRRDEGTSIDELLSQRSDMRFSLLLVDDPDIQGVDSVTVVVEYVVDPSLNTNEAERR